VIIYTRVTRAKAEGACHANSAYTSLPSPEATPRSNPRVRVFMCAS
jgi:hypothetical protein